MYRRNNNISTNLPAKFKNAASDAMLFAAAAIFVLMAMYKSLLFTFLDKNHVLGCIGQPNLMNM